MYYTVSTAHFISCEESCDIIMQNASELALWNSSVEDTCPGFGQDRVNFHQTPGRGTAGRADPTWPNRARYSIPCAVTLGSRGWGWRRELTRSSGVHGAGPVWDSGCLGRAICCCVFSLFVSLLFLFSLCLLFC